MPPKTGNKTAYYAVKKGKKRGIYKTWAECQEQISGFSGAVYKKFATEPEALNFMLYGIDTNDAKTFYFRGNKNHKGYTGEKTTIKPELIEFCKNHLTSTDNAISCINEINKLKTITDNTYYIFTDGSKQKSHTSYGIYFPGLSCHYAELLEPDDTNNIAELSAILKTLHILLSGFENLLLTKNGKHPNKYIIVSDSEYSIKSITIWYKKWIKNNWQTTSGKPVANVELITEIREKLDKLSKYAIIEFKHQKSHNLPPHITETSPTANVIKYLLWEGNYIVDYLVQKTVINQNS